MLRPIPGVLLKDKMQLNVCTGLDAWQKAAWETYEVNGVHLQTTNEVKKTKDNTEVVLRSVLFIDGAVSLPQLDYGALMAQSEKENQCAARYTTLPGKNAARMKLLRWTSCRTYRPCARIM